MNYLPVNVYVVADSSYDCSNGGVSFTHTDRLVVPCKDGHLSDDIFEKGYELLELEERDNFPSIFRPKCEEGKHTMFGGAFIYSSDSRFRRAYGDHPIALHDRVEVF